MPHGTRRLPFYDRRIAADSQWRSSANPRETTRIRIWGTPLDSIRNIPTDVLVFYFVLYGCLPLWTVMGFIDYMCHRASHIERTSGLRESLLHAVMGVQVGIPVFLGLFFQINVMVLLLVFIVLVFHEWVAHMDVKYARGEREISITETHAHSFLEVIPFMIAALVVCMNWSAFIDLVTLNWSGQMVLKAKVHPLNTTYLALYVASLVALDVIPYIEELWRCRQWQSRHGETNS